MDYLSNPKYRIKKRWIIALSGCLIALLLFILINYILWSVEKGFHRTSFLSNEHIVYLNDDKEALRGFQTLENETYYFDKETGYMHTGFLEEGDDLYYFDEEGKQKTGLQTIDNKTYYFKKDGTAVKKSFKEIKKEEKKRTVYFKKDGTMATKSAKINGVSYKFNKEGTLLPDTEQMKASIETILEKYAPNNSVYFKDLKTGETFSINDTNMYPCSIIKMFVMATVYDQIEQGNLKEEDCQIYLEAMMIHSDNTSYNHLLTLLGNGDPLKGKDLLNHYIQELGFEHTAVHHGLIPGQGYFSDGKDNTTRPSEIAKLLEMIYNKKIITEKYCDKMIKLMKKCADDSGIADSLPEGTDFAHKSGWADAYYLDGGIVYSKYGDYILVVFTDSSYQMPCREISTFVHDYLNILS